MLLFIIGATLIGFPLLFIAGVTLLYCGVIWPIINQYKFQRIK